MPDAAHYAAMSWPDQNYHFKRGWAKPPPQSERGPDAAGAASRVSLVNGSSNSTDDIHTFRLMQRAKAWETAAAYELNMGHHACAERLARLVAGALEAAL